MFKKYEYLADAIQVQAYPTHVTFNKFYINVPIPSKNKFLFYQVIMHKFILNFLVYRNMENVFKSGQWSPQESSLQEVHSAAENHRWI